MAARKHDGAKAPGPVTPAESDDARELGSSAGTKGQGQEDSADSAAAHTARKPHLTLVARAALLGIEVHGIGAEQWLLRHARGACIGTVNGCQALDAAIAGFEAAVSQVRALVQRTALRQGVGR